MLGNHFGLFLQQAFPVLAQQGQPPNDQPPAFRQQVEVVATRLPDVGGLMRCLAYAPDGKTLAVGSLDQTIKLYDLEISGNVIKQSVEV